MTRPLRLEYENAFYHIISRGDRKDYIFEKKEYKLKFIEKMDEAFKNYSIECYAYCIMDNHYHLYLSTPLANIKEAMTYLNASYSNWYKAKTKKVGHVFQGRYKSILIDSDNYSYKLINYIHLNPVKAKIVNSPLEYNFSSVNFYVGKRGKKISNLNKELLLFQLDKNLKIAEKKYLDLIEKEEINKDFKKGIYKSVALGNELFIKKIENKLNEVSENSEIPTTHMNKTRYPNVIINKVKEEFKIKDKDIFNKKRGNIYKKMVIYLLKTRTRMKLSEIGLLFKISYKAVSKNSIRFEKEIEKSKEIKDKIKEILK